MNTTFEWFKSMGNTINYFSKARVETFSDGVFAIIVTLLVLEIKIPTIDNYESSKALLDALVLIIPKMLTWMISFLIICVIWVNHHRIFEQIKTITHGIFWFNANLLMWCSLIPFPKALLGSYANNLVALIAFGVILALAAFAFTMLRWNIILNAYTLNENVDLKHFKIATRKSLVFGPTLYLLGAMNCLIHPYLSFIVYFFIPIYFIFYNSIKTN